MTLCATPATWESLVAYWAGDLSADIEETLEEHLMVCASCAAESARVAAITEVLRNMIPPVVTRGIVDLLRARGRDVRETVFVPGDRREVTLPRDFDLFVFHLTGIDFSRVARADLTLSDETTGDPIAAVREIPFDREAGEVLLCCQRHYASLPPDVVVEVRTHETDGTERCSRYTILHRFRFE